MDYVYDKPVLTFYRERHDKPEIEAFAVVKANKLAISESEDAGLSGSIQDFFPLMGDVDCISSEEGRTYRYVVCWFDDEVDLSKSFRRLTGVTFPSGIFCEMSEKNKKTYNTTFQASHGKLK